jgi:two-component system, cell cycle sensor histidine kinase and response regulator CckA
VLSTSNGLEAIELIESQQRPIDLILTDVVMPRLSGRELSEHISRLQPAAKVLFMSGYTNDAVVNHGILDGAAWFIQKPFTIASLIRRVREVLDSHEPRAQSPVNLELSGAAVN